MLQAVSNYLQHKLLEQVFLLSFTHHSLYIQSSAKEFFDPKERMNKCDCL